MRQGITYVGTLTPEEASGYEALNQESSLVDMHHSDELRNRRLEFHLSVINRMKKESECRGTYPRSAQDEDALQHGLSSIYEHDIVP